MQLRRVQNGCYQEFQYLMLSIHLFPTEATLLESFMSDKLQSQKISLMERHYNALKFA